MHADKATPFAVAAAAADSLMHCSSLITVGAVLCCAVPCAVHAVQIVSNAVNGLDVDKVDYLVRDSLMAGVSRQQLDVSHFIPLVTQHCKVSSRAEAAAAAEAEACTQTACELTACVACCF